MRRNLAFLITMTAAALAQTPSVVDKPTVKAATVKLTAASVDSAKPSPTKASAARPQSQPAVVSVVPVSAKPASGPKAKPAAATTQTKPVVVAPAKVAADGAKPSGKPQSTKAREVASAGKSNPAKPSAAKQKAQPQTVSLAEEQSKPKDKRVGQEFHVPSRRDPFLSPVVSLGAGGSGCSTGKRCLAIDQILLRGVVKADSGRIAVVVNAMDKAYFLRENDPVFNGYVLKITGDSIVFKETFHDRLGKPLTRDVTKTITKPVA
jgi:hypothetical protein